MKSELRFYASILLKRLPIVIVITGLATAVAAYVAMTLPATYAPRRCCWSRRRRSRTNSPPRRSQNNAPEQLDIIQQRLLTRANLLDIANQLNVFPNRAPMVPDDVVDRMRANTSFRATFGRDRATTLTIAFTAGIRRHGHGRERIRDARPRRERAAADRPCGADARLLRAGGRPAGRGPEPAERAHPRVQEQQHRRASRRHELPDEPAVHADGAALAAGTRPERGPDMRDRITQIFQATGQLPGAARSGCRPHSRR
jgi:hypothetical protein